MSEPQIRLLGGVEVRRAGDVLPLAGRRARALMVLLALEAGRAVSIDTLARGLWGDEPPARVRGSLQTQVSRLRRVLGEQAIATTATGYRLDLPRDQVDVLRFRDGVERARALADPEDERALLDELLATWTGAPFGEELSSWIERYERPRLVEEHLQALERRLDLDLAAGRHDACVAELRALVEEHPLREPLWVRFLRALDGAGRTAEALEQYDVVRTRLATELGADPGPELQQVHQELLRPVRPPRQRRPDAESDAPAAAVPRQLPTTSHAFTGRRSERAALERAAGVESAGRVVAVHGPGGSGKTALVLAWARERVAEFPDGQLFVDLRGFGPDAPMPPAVAADLMLRGLGVPGSEVPADPEARSALLRTILADRRCLMVLDNARDAGQVRPLLPGGPSLVLVTSRSQLRSLAAREGALRIGVGPMEREESVRMLRTRLDLTAVAEAEQDALVGELAELCGHLPVALSIAAERCGRGSGSTLAAVVAELRDEAGRLDQLATGDDDLTDVRAVLDWTLRALEPDAARVFRLLGHYPDGVVCRYAAVSLAGLPWARGRELLDRLADHHLLDPLPDGWFGIHDLVRAFARRRAEEAEHAEERDQAWRRLVSWYVHSAANAREALAAGGTQVPRLPVVPLVEPQRIESGAAAVAWFDSHRSALRTLMARCEELGEWDTVARLGQSLDSYLSTICASAEEAAMAHRSDAAARATDDPTLQAVTANRLGTLNGELGRLDTATEHLQRAQGLFAEVGDVVGELRVMSNVAHVRELRGEQDAAIEIHEEVLRRTRGLDDQEELGAALCQLASALNNAGEHERAWLVAEEGVQLSRHPLAPVRLALCLDFRAAAEHDLGRLAEAERSYRSALEIYLVHGDVRNAAETLEELGIVQRHAGDPEAAAASWQRAVDLLTGLGHEQVASWVTRLRGDIEQLFDARATLGS